MSDFNEIREKGLYDPSFEHDNCGIGAIIDIEGRKSHQLVDDALSIVERLEHRAGKDAEGKTGDGVGILTQVPHRFFVRKMKEAGVRLPSERGYGVGMFFFPQKDLEMRQARSMFEIIVRKAGLNLIAWRKSGGRAIKWLNGVNGYGKRYSGERIGDVFHLRNALIKAG